jgi:23S rRNA U2552 (ribose-2'-O)-methylase RlmE/FtsJ|tara:strand:+ start:276 stop:1451 length:1176 start_codon:yes stop_codon:yes gene_type:complete
MTFFILPTTINHLDPSDIEIQEGTPYFYISKTLQQYLANAKAKIDDCPVDWDIYKKYTNPYEYIQTQIPGDNISVSSLKPLSRSYFKMIEIVKTHNILKSYNDTPIKTFHLAEGPGGFIEALTHLRKNKLDVYYGITLLNDTIGIPGWNKSIQFLKKNPNVIIEKGVDGKGDLYNIDNLKDCTSKYGNSMDIITGDGGFDFSIDFNDQETTSTRLLFSQICFALSLQKKGGSFILKCFDCFNRSTIDLMYILFMFYDNCYVTKPLTSRIANSERYIVCLNFKYSDTSHLLSRWESMYMQFDADVCVNGFIKGDLPYYFVNKVEEINLIIGKTQIENILYTLRLIRQTNHNERELKIASVKKKNIDKCINWCKKFSVAYHNKIMNNIFISDI